MTTQRTDTAAFVRGKLHMAGVDRATPIATAVDVITVIAMDVPTDDLKKWRREFDSALWRVRPPDRATWGLRPDQAAETRRLTAGPAPSPGEPQSRAARGRSAPGVRPDDRFRRP